MSLIGPGRVSTLLHPLLKPRVAFRRSGGPARSMAASAAGVARFAGFLSQPRLRGLVSGCVVSGYVMVWFGGSLRLAFPPKMARSSVELPAFSTICGNPARRANHLLPNRTQLRGEKSQKGMCNRKHNKVSENTKRTKNLGGISGPLLRGWNPVTHEDRSLLKERHGWESPE